MPKQNLLKRFLKWRLKYISQKQFIYILSIIIGFAAGIVAVILKNLTHFIQLLLEGSFVQYYHTAFYFIFPIIGLGLTYLVIKYVIKHKVNHGIPSTLFAISKRKGIMKRFQMVGSILTAPITVGFGGSVGLEGPTVATGAAVSSNLSRLLHLNQSTRTLLIGCAGAGAMASIFKAPIAAIIFAVEVFSLDLTLASLMPLLLASLSGVITSYFFFGNEILLPFNIEDKFVLSDLPFYMLLGVVGAFASIYFTKTYAFFQDFFSRIKSPIKRLALGGIGLGVLIYFIPPLYGEGYDIMNNLIQGNPAAALENNFFNLELSNVWVIIALLLGLVIFKVIASALTFGAGGVGGIFAPTLFMGSILGNALAKALNNIGWFSNPVSESNFTLVGMTGLMAGVLHAPLTAIFLIAEVTGGYELFIPLMLTSAISFAITKSFIPHSVYAMELGRKGELITHNKDHAVLTLMEIENVVERSFIKVYSDMKLGEIIETAVVKSKRNIYPVVNRKNDKLEGIILLDDLRPIMFNQSLYNEVTARELMQNPPTIINFEKDRMTSVMKKFQDTGAWNLPVESKGVYYGFVSKSRLLTAYRRKLIDFSRS
ncbi:chloride channel protein [Marixanthomonas sp. SCSIO 43207]|uniref:chloride channel protein n=1 Tax=Marixanthomonas sp. SCSIO 43207 TaxID=2779360 RepID=UPI001CA95A62|nr:chloride channel protein [Marixanthomonas sp. SCSIO 43207]UAB81738.1 chloride channel protein [Marixanthomonas sp. SCSIO 43207]